MIPCWITILQNMKYSDISDDLKVGDYRSRGPCDIFDPWVRWERGQVGIWEFVRRRRRRRRRRLEIWKSKLVWNGSIWLDMAWSSRQNDRTDVAHPFCFQEVIKNLPRGSKKRPMTPKKCCLGVKKRGPWLKTCFFSKIWNFQNFKICPFRMSSY